MEAEHQRIADERESNRTIVRYLTGGALVGASILGGAWWAVLQLGESAEAAYALAGDAMAPLAALLSSLALAGALASVVLQSKELALQRAEMRQARMAQEALAAETKRASDVTERLAAAQEIANVHAARAVYVADVANSVAIVAARIHSIESMRSLLAAASYGGTHLDRALRGEASGIGTDADKIFAELVGHRTALDAASHKLLGDSPGSDT
jgi:hypothetical protein